MILCFIKNNLFMYSNSKCFVVFFFPELQSPSTFWEEDGRYVTLYLHPQGKK